MANILDIDLYDTHSVSSIGFADTSLYDSNYTISNVSFEITPPGFNKVNVTFTPHQINIFDASNLGLGTGEGIQLPDGIYTVTYSIYPNAQLFVTKSFIRTSLIECLYWRTFLAMNTKCDCNGSNQSRIRTKMRDIRFLIEGAIASANQCDIVNSEAKYNKAMWLLKKIKLCEC